MEATAHDLQIEQVNKWYPGGVHAVKDMNMEINEGEFVVFVGPSGCGKTTLLRMIAGLEQINDGKIRLGDRVINRVPPKDRDIAMVFQNYALYPTMKVWDNIAFPLKMRKLAKQQIGLAVLDVARRVGIADLLERRPVALSGGQRQRVALARAMVRRPRLFLMDEPLANLDAKLRVNMRREIVSLQRDLGVTTIYVTHDQTEAMTMGTRIAVMKDGVLQQLGTPREIYSAPHNLFTAQFIGSPPMNVWDGEVWREADTTRLSLGSVSISLNSEDAIPERACGRPLCIGIRPEHIVPASPDSVSAVQILIESTEHTGRETMIFLTSPELPPLTMAVGGDSVGQPGESISVRLNTAGLHFFDRKTGERL